MRHDRLIRAFVGLLAVSAGCADEEDDSLQAGGAYDSSVDFSMYQTYDLVQPQDIPDDETAPRAYLEVNREAVMRSIVEEMESRGYVRDPSFPDLRISPLVRLEEDEVVIATTYHWYDYYYGWYWGYGYPWYTVDVVEFTAGTLIIDAVDLGEPQNADDDRLVFRGYAKAILPPEPSDVSDQIPVIVSRIFDFWPPVDG